MSDALQPVFHFLICLDVTKLVHSASVFILILETVCLKNWAKPQPKNAKLPLPVDVRRSKKRFFLSSLLPALLLLSSLVPVKRTSDWTIATSTWRDLMQVRLSKYSFLGKSNHEEIALAREFSVFFITLKLKMTRHFKKPSRALK